MCPIWHYQTGWDLRHTYFKWLRQERNMRPNERDIGSYVEVVCVRECVCRRVLLCKTWTSGKGCRNVIEHFNKASANHSSLFLSLHSFLSPPLRPVHLIISSTSSPSTACCSFWSLSSLNSHFAFCRHDPSFMYVLLFSFLLLSLSGMGYPQPKPAMRKIE